MLTILGSLSGCGVGRISRDGERASDFKVEELGGWSEPVDGIHATWGILEG